MTMPIAMLLQSLGIRGPALEWAAERNETVETAWSACPRADWLLDIAAHSGVERLTLLRAASECVLLVLPLATSEPAARRAWATSLRWTVRRADAPQCRDAAAEAIVAARAHPTHTEVATVLRATAWLALACDDVADVDLAAWAFQRYAADAVREATAAGGRAAAVRTVEVVREHIPYELLVAATGARSRFAASSGVRAKEPAAPTAVDEPLVTARSGKRKE